MAPALAAQATHSSDAGWYIGLSVGFAVVVVVVAVVALVLTYAGRIVDQTQAALDAARTSEQAMSGVSRESRSVGGLRDASQGARRALPER